MKRYFYLWGITGLILFAVQGPTSGIYIGPHFYPLWLGGTLFFGIAALLQNQNKT